MTTPDVLKGMVAVSKDSKVKPLGYIVWSSVPMEDVSLSRVIRRWGMAGLDPQPLPRDPRAVDAFKRAVRDEEKAGTYVDDKTGTKVETDIRLVLENNEDVIYQVTRVERDTSDERVLYSGAVKVWFSKASETVGFKALEGANRPTVVAIMDSIQTRVDQNAKRITGAKVREMVRDYIVNVHDEGRVDEKTGKTYGNQVGLSGTPIGGPRQSIYFVLERHRRTLDALAEFLNSLYKPEGRAFLYYAPMADGASERELIRRSFMTTIMEELEEEIATVADLLRPVNPNDTSGDARKRGVREDVMKHHYGKLDQLKRKLGEYQGALKSEVGDVETRMEVLNRQLRKLLGV
jgi:hypothetical protein